MTGPLDRPVHITLFDDLSASTRESSFLPLSEFANTRLRDDRAPIKDDLKLFSPCSYDNARTTAKSLRHDANIRELFACIADYDGEVTSFVDAVAAARQAHVAMVIVTTASHTPDRPRWRAVALLAQPLHKDHSLAEHAKLTARLSGIFPDIISAESWTKSQSWFIGTVAGAPDHRIELIDGDYLDQRPDLDAGAQPKPTPAPKAAAKTKRTNGPPTALPLLDDPDRPADIDDALLAIARGEGSHAALVYLCGKFAVDDVPIEQAEATLLGAADQRPDEKRDAGWHKMRRDIPRTLSQIYDKEASAQATLSAVIASATKRGNGAGLVLHHDADTGADGAGADAGGPPPPPGAGTGGSGSGPAPGGPPPPQPGVGPATGVRGMLRDKRPRYAGNVANVITVLLTAQALAGCIAYDEMGRDVSLRRALPGDNRFTEPRRWTDADTGRLQDWLQRHAEMARVGKGAVDQGVDIVARMHPFHPVKDYLRGLKWDGTKRLDSWLMIYLGVEPSDYAAKTGYCWMIGMVARIEQPGCKFETMLIWEGPQGAGKSRAARALGTPWFSDQTIDVEGDQRLISQHLRNLWLVEMSELTHFRAAKVEALKEFLGRPEEKYVPRYAAKDVIEPRQCGFVGTTNAETYLHDVSGARRFWPHRVGTIDVEALIRDRDQLWAEAAVAYRAGEQWWIDAAFEQTHVQPEQEARYDADGWTPLVADYLDEFEAATQNAQVAWDKQSGTKTPAQRPIVQITLIAVFRKALRDPPSQHDVAPEKFTPQAQQRVRAILLSLGWGMSKKSGSHRWWTKS